MTNVSSRVGKILTLRAIRKPYVPQIDHHSFWLRVHYNIYVISLFNISVKKDLLSNTVSIPQIYLCHILRLFHYKPNSLKVNGILAIHRCSSSWTPNNNFKSDILDIKSGISLSKPWAVLPNRVVNQQHFVERNLIVFCLRGWWHPHPKILKINIFIAKGITNFVAWCCWGFSLKCWSNLSLMSLQQVCNKFQVVCSCVSTLWSAYASTCLSQQIVRSAFWSLSTDDMNLLTYRKFCRKHAGLTTKVRTQQLGFIM